MDLRKIFCLIVYENKILELEEIRRFRGFIGLGVLKLQEQENCATAALLL